MNQASPETQRSLCQALADYGLSTVADHLATLALRPGTRPETHVEHAERHLQGWRRGEPDRLEHAVARLLWCALALKLSPEISEQHRERGDSCRSVPFRTGDPGEPGVESQK
jgi:hypothetical protein